MGENKFDYGEYVKVKEIAPIKYCPGQIASVCGMTKMESKILADRHYRNIGEWLYTIEFVDGSSIEIPECYLSADEEKIIE